VRPPTIEDFMKITINNWVTWLPRTGLKSVPWIRIPTSFAYEPCLFELTNPQKWLFIFCVLEAGKVNKEGSFECSTKWLIHGSGCTEGEIDEGLKALENQTLITVMHTPVHEEHTSVHEEHTSVSKSKRKRERERKKEREKREPEKHDREDRSSHDPEGPLTFCEWKLGSDWYDHAMREMPWKAKASGWDPRTFGELLCKVRNSTGLSDEGMRAVLDFISANEFWTKNAVSPKGLLNKGRNGLRKIDTILSQMKTPEMRRDEKLLEWANGPERNVWGELV